MHGVPKRIVYILRSEADTSRHYIGLTHDLQQRSESASGCAFAKRNFRGEPSQVLPPFANTSNGLMLA
jgi:hypothetical protein